MWWSKHCVAEPPNQFRFEMETAATIKKGRNSLNKIRKSGQRQENYQAILESLVNEAAREGKSSVRTARSAAVEPATTTLLKIEEHTQESWA